MMPAVAVFLMPSFGEILKNEIASTRTGKPMEVFHSFRMFIIIYAKYEGETNPLKDRI